MFSKGSRYRSLSDLIAPNRKGERLLGKELRLIPGTAGQFLHTVHAGDRLDLLAFNYYDDATRWWQIADANPAFPFPGDLLETKPLGAERLVLFIPGFAKRIDDLQQNLTAFGEVERGTVSCFDAKKSETQEPHFIETTLVVSYHKDPSMHRSILTVIEDAGFHVLYAVAHERADTKISEAFTFDDPSVRKAWRELVEGLEELPGMLHVRSLVAESALEIDYNSAALERQSILGLLGQHGFVLDPTSVQAVRIGEKIVIPPNQVG